MTQTATGLALGGGFMQLGHNKWGSVVDVTHQTARGINLPDTVTPEAWARMALAAAQPVEDHDQACTFLVDSPYEPTPGRKPVNARGGPDVSSMEGPTGPRA